MNAEERTETAITATRLVLKKALESPFTMAVITMDELNPEHLQDKVYEVLCYLEKTKSAFAKGAGK